MGRNVNMYEDLKIGVLELQGDFAEHSAMLGRLGARVVPIRSVEHLIGIDGVIIPGGESTTIGKLMRDWDILPTLKKNVADGLACFGTCAGCILMAKDVTGYDTLPRLGTMNVTVTRNAYGSQVDSFETDVLSEFWKGEKLHAINIRAPSIDAVGEGVQVLASFGEKAVLVREDNMIACTFHPELTDDTRVHELYLKVVRESKRTDAPKT
mmetsp:Transcript_2681/g.3902  ORF Transcript_2681/g.3902 Transcript_2681/m.3902 type:complete len:210 (-) Transcript_2681:581-1210(-)